MEMIKANRDPSVEIKASDRFAYHVRLERRSVKPGNEQYPEVSHFIKCYTIKTYEHLEGLRTAPNPVDWVRSGGYVSAFVVHNPHLEEPEEVKAPEKTDTTVSDARKAQQRERMRIANATRAAKKAADNAK